MTTFFNPADQPGSPGSDAEDGHSAATALVDYATIALCDAPTAKPLSELAEYWRSKCTGPGLPTRASIDPTEIVQHLPWVFMADVIDNGADYRYRLLGTNIVAANYRDATGHSFRELYSGDATKLAGARLGFDHALTTGAPAFTQGRAFWRPDWAFDHFESAFLPLAGGSGRIEIIFGEIAYLTQL